MTTYGAYLWCGWANMQVAALEALPNLDTGTLKDFAGLNALKKLVIALVMSLLNLANKTHLSGDLFEALFLGGLGKISIHGGPLVVLTCSGILQSLGSRRNLAIMQILKPQLGVNVLVTGCLIEDIGNLLISVF